MVAPDMLEANKGYLGPIKFTFTDERIETIRKTATPPTKS